MPNPDLSHTLAWERELDRIEADVTTAEWLVTERQPAELAPWSAPTLAGPMPAHLVQRSADLLARIRLLGTRIPTAMDQTSRQLGATRRVAEATGQGRRPSLYVDTSV
jgi:hypothetical protein